MRLENKALLEFLRSQACAWCGRPGPSQVHHVECVGMGGGRRLDSFLCCLPACAFCHGKYQADRKAGFAKIAEREGLESGDVVQELVWQILRAPKRERA